MKYDRYPRFLSVHKLNGSSWEGGYVYAWERKPSKKALKLSGAASAEVIISFETYAAFSPDPAFGYGNNSDLTLKEKNYINSYMPVRACIRGHVSISNVQIEEVKGVSWKLF